MELFEELRREYEFRVGSIAGVARKFGVHSRPELASCPRRGRAIARLAGTYRHTHADHPYQIRVNDKVAGQHALQSAAHGPPCSSWLSRRVWFIAARTSRARAEWLAPANAVDADCTIVASRLFVVTLQ